MERIFSIMKRSLEIGVDKIISKLLIVSSYALALLADEIAIPITINGAIIVNIWAFKNPSIVLKSNPADPPKN